MQASLEPALVLRRVEYGDADLILTLFCRERGKVSALARGARRSKRRFGASLGLFSVSEMELRRRGEAELFTLSSARLRTDFSNLALDMACFAHASYATEVVRELTPAEHGEPRLFDLLVAFFAGLSENGASSGALRVFEMSVLRLVGLEPVVDCCAACGVEDASAFGGGTVFDPSRGGVVCANCARTSTGLGVRHLSEKGRAALVAARSAASGGQAAPELLAEAEARDCLVAFILGHIGHPIRSLDFIAKMRSAAGP